jgi:hypothetical protein
VEFPEVALRTAHWEHGALLLQLAVHLDDPTGTTSFRLEGVDPKRKLAVDKGRSTVAATLTRDGEGWLVRAARASGVLRIAPKD